MEKAALYENMLNSVQQAVMATTLEGEITYWNRFAEKLYGWKMEEVAGKNVVEVTPADMSRKEAAFIMRMLKKGEIWEGDFMVKRKDGSEFMAHVVDCPIQDDEGNLVGIIGISEDITDKRNTKKELSETELKFKTMLEDITDFIVRWQPDGTLVYVNDTYLNYFGLSRDEMTGRTFWDLVVEKDREKVKEKFNNLTPENPVLTDIHQVYRPDGTESWNEWTDRAYFDEQGRIYAFQSVGRDITAWIEAEKILQRNHKELEKLVMDRTEELEEKNTELERLNRLFVGREIRIKELKNRVQALEKGNHINY